MITAIMILGGAYTVWRFLLWIDQPKGMTEKQLKMEKQLRADFPEFYQDENRRDYYQEEI